MLLVTISQLQQTWKKTWKVSELLNKSAMFSHNALSLHHGEPLMAVSSDWHGPQICEVEHKRWSALTDSVSFQLIGQLLELHGPQDLFCDLPRPLTVVPLDHQIHSSGPVRGLQSADGDRIGLQAQKMLEELQILRPQTVQHPEQDQGHALRLWGTQWQRIDYISNWAQSSYTGF